MFITLYVWLSTFKPLMVAKEDGYYALILLY